MNHELRADGDVLELILDEAAFQFTIARPDLGPLLLSILTGAATQAGDLEELLTICQQHAVLSGQVDYRTGGSGELAGALFSVADAISAALDQLHHPDSYGFDAWLAEHPERNPR